MRVRIAGGGWYGCHLATALISDGHEVELHETADRLFAGASGGNPARLHIGPHYPRSHLTRAACRDHHAEFMARYGHLTRGVPINIYAIAAHDSLLDFDTYRQVLRGEIEFITIAKPEEFGLRNVEGAILCGERHIVIDEARKYFTKKLDDRVRYGVAPGSNSDAWDAVIDCTFCANDAENIDRFEPCVTALLKGPTDRAVTIMDGPAFGSIYPWNEDLGLSSLTSAKLTPFSKTCRTYAEARAILDDLPEGEIYDRAYQMLEDMAHFWPACLSRYRIVDYRLSIRAMPRSAADARLVDVVRVGERALRVRAGKIDAVFHAERIIREMLNGIL